MGPPNVNSLFVGRPTSEPLHSLIPCPGVVPGSTNPLLEKGAGVIQSELTHFMPPRCGRLRARMALSKPAQKGLSPGG